MNGQEPQLDLVLLVPGKDEKSVLETLLLRRTESLGIRPVRFQTLVHPNRDSGCLRQASELLRGFLGLAEHALVVFDHVGSGQESLPPDELNTELERRLAASGWNDRAKVVVVEPELEGWVWSGSPHVDRVFRWERRQPDLRTWLCDQGLWPADDPKPGDPKRAVELALRNAGIPRSSAVYGRLAEHVGLSSCANTSFRRLKGILAEWFPAQ